MRQKNGSKFSLKNSCNQTLAILHSQKLDVYDGENKIMALLSKTNHQKVIGSIFKKESEYWSLNLENKTQKEKILFLLLATNKIFLEEASE